MEARYVPPNCAVHHAVLYSPSRLRNMGMWGPVLGVIPAVSEERESTLWKDRTKREFTLAISLRRYLPTCLSIGRSSFKFYQLLNKETTIFGGNATYKISVSTSTLCSSSACIWFWYDKMPFMPQTISGPFNTESAGCIKQIDHGGETRYRFWYLTVERLEDRTGYALQTWLQYTNVSVAPGLSLLEGKWVYSWNQKSISALLWSDF